MHFCIYFLSQQHEIIASYLRDKNSVMSWWQCEVHTVINPWHKAAVQITEYVQLYDGGKCLVEYAIEEKMYDLQLNASFVTYWNEGVRQS